MLGWCKCWLWIAEVEEAEVALGLRRRSDDKHATELVTAVDWALNEDKWKKSGL